jgi:type IV pilus biogenesis protein CpaD/CtpE
MKNRILAVALAAALASCQTQPGALDKVKTGQPVALTPLDTQIVVHGVQASLKDPSSAMVSGLRASMADNVVSVCGYVNGKNSYGAYTGNMPFNGTLATNNAGNRVFLVTGIGDGGTYSQAVMMVCAKMGAPI